MSTNDSEQGQGPGIEDKIRKLKYWGLGATAVGILLELSVVILDASGTLMLIGVVLSFAGLGLLGEAKGQSAAVAVFALAPLLGPVLGFLCVVVIDVTIRNRRWRIWANNISAVMVLAVLSAMVLVNLTTYGAKARTSEAKVGLGGIATAAISFFAENKTFVISDIKQLGYEPAGAPRYTFWYSVKGVPTRINVVSVDLARSCDGPPTTVQVSASATGFTAAARGNIDSDPTCDEWSINDARQPVHTLDDLEQSFFPWLSRPIWR